MIFGVLGAAKSIGAIPVKIYALFLRIFAIFPNTDHLAGSDFRANAHARDVRWAIIKCVIH